MADDPLLVLRTVADVFDDLGVAYFVGGSIASSYYGQWRSTQDIDFVAGVRPEHVGPLADALSAREFLADADLIAAGVARGDAFNLLHLVTFYKVDVFVAATTVWAGQEMARRRTARLLSGGAEIAFYVASPEDMVRQKLIRFGLSGRSERQWRDVQEMLKVQAGALDFAYLRRWAGELGLADLLGEALDEAGLSGGAGQNPGRRP